VSSKTVSLAIALCALSSGVAQSRNESPPPAGTKVATGNFFDVYVLEKEKQAAPANYVARVYQVTFLARTTRHGVQRFTKRIETLDADLLSDANWQVADLDGDRLDDVRYLAQRTKSGCEVWPALRWEKVRERFTQGGPQMARQVDARGRVVQSCAPARS